MDRWIAVDWGTSSFRAYLIQDDVLSDTIETKDGMKFVKDNNFENTFINLIEKWLIKDKKIDVLASGMLGARQGWIEAPYEKAPCNLNNINYISPILIDNRISLKIFSGISQNNPPDVMRGEETQVAGFLTDNNNFNGSICLPGTHSKWIKINKNSLEKFQTFMTGELFEIISKNSVLSHSVKSENLDKCKFNKKYGNYCFKHRSKYLLDGNGIIIDKFTNHKKDYLSIDLMIFCKKNNIKIKSSIISFLSMNST